MKTEDEDSHLHIFPTGSSGKDRLLSALQSDFTQPVVLCLIKKPHFMSMRKIEIVG